MRSSPWQASPEVAERAVGPTDFRILGPVGVTVGGRPLVIGGARNRAVLAALLLSAGRVVSIDQLVEATWGPNPPAGARSQIQNRISKLRSALEPVPVPATGGLIRTVGGGYVIRPGADELDQDRFTALTALADRLLATGDPAGAAQALGRALDLRSGPALDGLGTPYLSSAAHGIEERLLVAFERLMQLHLLLRRHAEVIGELRCMTDAHPIREQLHALLMLALFRDGRLAEALDVYRTVRAALVDQFGLEPGATLQALNDAMLRSDPRLLTADLDGVLAITTAARTPPPHPAPHTAPPVPRELPAAAPLFGGRAEQLRRLDELAARPGGATGRGARCEHTAATAATVVITGAPGTGKTALAVHWGHRVGGEFPDGQLHLDLRGYGPEPPLPPLGALTALLRSLGAVGYDPDDVTAA
ncbi:MAG TPA: AfsR/SARP family transcriptional regulator, partial [Micromonosporaceae bacterium]